MRMMLPTLAKSISASSKSFNRMATWLSSADFLVVIRPNFLCMLCILDLERVRVCLKDERVRSEEMSHSEG